MPGQPITEGARIAPYLLCVAALTAGHEPKAQPLSIADRLHVQAVDQFRRGRFPEAYGRFIALANAGHAPSAKVSLWMCEQGPALFGREWDCTPDEVSEWTRLARPPETGRRPR